MLLRCTILAVLSSLACICIAQDVPILKPADLRAATIIKTDFYAGKALFGYIDGGAELYLEYKFQKLGRQEIKFSDETIIAEIYQMEGAYEAYGIFSIQRFKCVPVDSASPNTCRSRYQLQAVLGNCYLSIVNESGTAASQKASVEIYRALKSRIKSQEIPFPAVFRKPELARYSGRQMVICGTLGVQNGLTEWEPFFQGIPRFTLTVLPIERGADHLTIAHIRFLSVRDQLEFCLLTGFNNVGIGPLESRESGGSFRGVRRVNEEEILFLEASNSFPDRQSFIDLLANEANHAY
jgi:hypothetical protein